MGKYDTLKSKLPKFEQEPTFQRAVDAVKIQYQALDAPELARIYSLERRRKKDFEEQIADLNVGLEALNQLILDRMEAGGLKKFSLASGECCFQQTEPYSSIQDRQALMAWIKKQRMQNLLTLQWQTLNAMNKERLLAGKPEIPGTKAWNKTSIRMRSVDHIKEPINPSE
jgi:phage host-nuclease inhibitor protein Gam